MAQVLLVGITPEEVDFTDPALPPGMDAVRVREGVSVALATLGAAGHDTTQLYLPAAVPAARQRFATALASRRFDCVVIGAGVTNPPRNRALFEALLNVIVRASPAPAIGLISRPDEADQAVRRVLAD